jgi:TonB family protein
MKKNQIVLLFIFTLYSICIFGQSEAVLKQNELDHRVSFGTSENSICIFEFINNNLTYPEIARQHRVEGTVVVGFIVEKDGMLSELKIVRDIGAGTGAEALRIAQLMNNQDWFPGVKNGQLVKSYFYLPIKFKFNWPSPSYTQERIEKENQLILETIQLRESLGLVTLASDQVYNRNESSKNIEDTSRDGIVYLSKTTQGCKIGIWNSMYSENLSFLTADCVCNNDLLSCDNAFLFIKNGNNIIGTYTGEIVNGLFEGDGELRFGDIELNGKFNEGMIVEGEMKFKESGITYEGSFKNYMKHGYGVEINPSYGKYEGEWVNDSPYGKGRLYNNYGGTQDVTNGVVNTTNTGNVRNENCELSIQDEGWKNGGSTLFSNLREDDTKKVWLTPLNSDGQIQYVDLSYNHYNRNITVTSDWTSTSYSAPFDTESAAIAWVLNEYQNKYCK